MNRLIRRDRFMFERHSLSKVEDPFFARSTVRFFLYNPYSLPGLNDLIKECSSELGQYQQLQEDRIIEKIEKRQWYLLTERPLCPLAGRSFLTHRAGERSVATQADIQAKYEDLTSVVKFGPGKWQKSHIDYHGAVNSFFLLANRSRSMSNEGQVIFSDPGDLANTIRTLLRNGCGLKLMSYRSSSIPQSTGTESSGIKNKLFCTPMITGMLAANRGTGCP
ncbi:hypothetical protein [Pseudomonas shirazensis]|uniref:hypothetical protein n=1 Tax=Pseudomonas shirazensis TaxID=2745494 RepID=UPI003986EEC6